MIKKKLGPKLVPLKYRIIGQIRPFEGWSVVATNVGKEGPWIYKKEYSVGIFDTPNMAAETLHINPYKVLGVLRGNIGSTKRYVFEYLGEEINVTKE